MSVNVDIYFYKKEESFILNIIYDLNIILATLITLCSKY